MRPFKLYKTLKSFDIMFPTSMQEVIRVQWLYLLSTTGGSLETIANSCVRYHLPLSQKLYIYLQYERGQRDQSLILYISILYSISRRTFIYNWNEYQHDTAVSMNPMGSDPWPVTVLWLYCYNCGWPVMVALFLETIQTFT